MKAEEQIFSLMVIAEEQQRLVTQSIEHQEGLCSSFSTNSKTM